jgi:hypothetical protein
MRPPGLFGSVVFACFVGIRTVSAAPSEQSISTSRQFIVHGSDLALRGVICDLAERTKRELLGLVGQRDDWILPIVINARRPQANLPELPRLNVELGQTGFGLKLQLDVLIDPGTSRGQIRRELLRTLILEMMYRREPQLPSGACYSTPPDWLLDGIQSEESDLPRDRVAALLALSARSENVWPLHRFVTQRADLLDAAGRTLYRAYSCALVDMLGATQDGPRRLMQFICDLPRASNDRMDELRNHFPEVFGAESAELTWQKHIVRLSSGQAWQPLNIVETERRLAEILRFTISDQGQERSYDLVEFPAFQKDVTARQALVALEKNLTALATRAHPFYGAIIAEYAQIVSSIVRGRTLRIPQRLAQLAATRRAMSGQMRQIDDYLNWFEATSLVKPSGEFGAYMEAAERAGQPGRTRRDSISIYLDALETQFERE